jgi:hypothetical protein
MKYTYLSSLKELHKGLALVILAALLLSAFGIPMLIQKVNAAAITDAYDLISNSNPGGSGNHGFSFITQDALEASDTITMVLEPSSTTAFRIPNLATSTLVLTGMTLTSTCSGAASEVTAATSSAPATITLTVCAGDTVAAGLKTASTTGNGVINPLQTGSYVVRIDTSDDESIDTRIVIVDTVLVTASVDTIFTFTVTGTTTGQTINGEPYTTSVVTTPTTIPFGTLSPGVPKVAGQYLQVVSNARNGFQVTVRANQTLLGASGADIDTFSNGTSVATPAQWSTSTNVLGSEATYGHWGLTSTDDPPGAENNFGTALYVGNFINNDRIIFYHSSSTDGTVDGTGFITVGYKIQVESLQEAASDYNATLTYIATPTF